MFTSCCGRKKKNKLQVVSYCSSHVRNKTRELNRQLLYLNNKRDRNRYNAYANRVFTDLTSSIETRALSVFWPGKYCDVVHQPVFPPTRFHGNYY